MFGSVSQCCSRSLPLTSDLLPTETNSEMPMPSSPARLISSMPRPPDCDRKATGPRTGSHRCERRVHPHFGRGVHDAEAVRTDDAHPVAARGRHDRPFALLAARADLRESGGDDDDAVHAFLRRTPRRSAARARPAPRPPRHRPHRGRRGCSGTPARPRRRRMSGSRDRRALGSRTRAGCGRARGRSCPRAGSRRRPRSNAARGCARSTRLRRAVPALWIAAIESSVGSMENCTRTVPSAKLRCACQPASENTLSIRELFGSVSALNVVMPFERATTARCSSNSVPRPRPC